MELQVCIDRETFDKLTELRFVYAFPSHKATLKFARQCYKWCAEMVGSGWIIGSMADGEISYRLFTRNYRERGLFAPGERLILGEVTKHEEMEIMNLFERSGAADLSAMTTKAIWLLADITDAVSMGKDVCAVSEETGGYCTLNRIEFNAIRP